MTVGVFGESGVAWFTAQWWRRSPLTVCDINVTGDLVWLDWGVLRIVGDQVSAVKRERVPEGSG